MDKKFWRLRGAKEVLVEQSKDPETGKFEQRIVETRPSKYLEKRKELTDLIKSYGKERERQHKLEKKAYESCMVKHPNLDASYIPQKKWGKCHLEARKHGVRAVKLLKKELGLEEKLSAFDAVGFKEFSRRMKDIYPGK